MPCTTSRKFAYTDALATQAINLEHLNSTWSQDLKVMELYFIYWCLSPNPIKTTVTAFSNRLANSKPQVSFCGKPIKNELFPKYLGVTLDHSLTFHEHLKQLTEKIKTRVNIIRKLAGTAGDQVHTLVALLPCSCVLFSSILFSCLG